LRISRYEGRAVVSRAQRSAIARGPEKAGVGGDLRFHNRSIASRCIALPALSDLGIEREPAVRIPRCTNGHTR
jgi:hypothetical protein